MCSKLNKKEIIACVKVLKPFLSEIRCHYCFFSVSTLNREWKRILNEHCHDANDVVQEFFIEVS